MNYLCESKIAFTYITNLLFCALIIKISININNISTADQNGYYGVHKKRGA